MWVLPFLYYHHAYPLTTFYQEWGAGVLGLMACSLLLLKPYWLQPEIPRIILLPIGLMLLVLLQYLLGMVTYFDQVLLFSFYMLWVMLLMMLAHALRLQLGLRTIATALAIFLLLGAELNALSGILQHFRWHTFLDSVVTTKNGIAVYGNMAQPNHYADYITLGLISLGMLRPGLRWWQAVFLAIPLLFVLVLSGSRSAWLYLVAITVMAFLWQRRDQSLRHVFNFTLILFLGFGLMHLIVQLPWLSGTSGSITALQRMMTGDTNGSIRLYLWHESWLIFTQFPIMGAGFGKFALQHFQLVPVLQGVNVTGLYNNAHNIVMQLAAEMGLAGVLIFTATMGAWLWQIRRVEWTLIHWWGYSALAIIGIHAMLEYPLWYAYFIGVVAILLGLFDTRTFKLELRAMGRLSVAAIIVLGIIVMFQLQQNYQSLERALAMRAQPPGDTTLGQRMREGLVAIYGEPLLQPYVELYMNSWVAITHDDLEAKLAFNKRAVEFTPIASVVYRNAWLLALAGKQEEARLQLERAIWSYPGDFVAQQRELEPLVQKYPAHFAALLEFAIQKNREYLSAISTR